MSGLEAHLWQVSWGNPYTSPPARMPRVLAEIFLYHVPGSSNLMPDVIAGYPRPQGYSVYHMGVMPPLKPRTPEQLASLRRGRLTRREQIKHPMFADEFIATSMAAKPDYYSGTEAHPERDAVLAAERERYEYLMERAGQLLVYSDKEPV